MEKPQTVSLTTNKPVIEKTISQSLSLQGPRMPVPISRSIGPDPFKSVSSYDELVRKLSSCGIQIFYSMFSHYLDGSVKLRFLYCKTTHGQTVIVECPNNIPIPGDLAIIEQEIGVLPDNVLQYVNKSLSGIHTGYAYLTGGGLHYVSAHGASPQRFGFGNYKEAKDLLGIKKWNYQLLAAVKWDSLAEPERLNSIESHIFFTNRNTAMSEIFERAHMSKLLSHSGPFTVFIPDGKHLDSLMEITDVQKLQAALYAHIVPGRVEYNRPDSSNTYKAFGENTITVLRSSSGVVIGIKDASGNEIKLSSQHPKPVSKSNGLIYRIDGHLTPMTNKVVVPQESDLDHMTTIFDINRTTMHIHHAQYGLNTLQTIKMLELADILKGMASTISMEIIEMSNHKSLHLLNDSNKLLQEFFATEIPCTEKCESVQKLEERIKEQNESFEKLSKSSNRLASMKYQIEKLIHRVSKIDQSLHVGAPIADVPEDSENEESDDE